MQKMTKHTFYKCPPGCDVPYCNFCEGGLQSCTVCKGGEGTLTSECCGEVMPKGYQDKVYAGEVDFRQGKWVIGLE